MTQWFTSIKAYRWIFLLLLFSAISSSIVVPVLAIFAKTILGASKLEVTSYFGVNALVGFFVVLIIGKLSDAFLSRKLLISGGFFWLAIGYALLASASFFWQMRLIGIFFFSALEIGNSQLFALAKDVSDSSAQQQTAAVTSWLRTAYAIGWVAGPALGGWLLLYLTAQHIFLISTVLYLICTGLTLWLLPNNKATHDPKTSYQALKKLFQTHQLPLLIFNLAIVCLLSGDILRVALLPIFLEETLKAPPHLLATTFSISPLLQILFMPIVGSLADYWGSGKLILVGITTSFIYYLGLALATTIWQIYLLQGVYALAMAIIIGVGINHAQKLGQGEAGLATSTFFSAKLIAVVIGSLLAGFMAEQYGVRVSFMTAAGLSALALPLVLYTLYPHSIYQPQKTVSFD